ncbi:transcriptional regulator TACO1-like protein [Mycotypha africana]|uniref:transcriptional regulator TACO1-like protein n=1 Tax=Mycotypha africana TaxID=64632 RepID=UPI00230063E3|nr:transcriptional regulator TACO1-like protein [Mycotypha africana]KAI8969236.1 transcriptional regulator TACO1-like protein [Mycotypha africana]
MGDKETKSDIHTCFPPILELRRLNQQRFAGHNKWSKVKHTKNAKDAKKSSMYSKIGLEITAAAKAGGTDPITNNKLQAALNRAKSANMPKDTIENALKRALDKNKDSLEKVTYECVGPGGIAMIVETLTDNKSRTVKEVKEVLNRVGGSVSSVGYLFDKKGKVTFTAGQSGHSFEQIMDHAIECGVEDIEEIPADEITAPEGETEGNTDNLIEVICEFSELNNVSKALMDRCQYEVQEIGPVYIPNSTVEVNDEETIEAVEKTFERMENLADVVKIHTNASFAN